MVVSIQYGNCPGPLCFVEDCWGDEAEDQSCWSRCAVSATRCFWQFAQHPPLVSGLPSTSRVAVATTFLVAFPSDTRIFVDIREPRCR